MTALVRSELLKVFTTRLWWGLLIGVVLTSAGFAVLIALVSGLSQGDGPPAPGLDDPAVVRGVYTAGLGTAYLFALAFGIISMAGEYRHKTMTATMLAAPRRTTVVLAKLVAVTVVGLGYGVAAIAGGVAAGALVIVIRNGELFLTSEGVPSALLLSVVAIALWAVLGLGVGTLIRNQVAALLIAVGVAWIAEPIAAFALNAAGAGRVAQYLPSQATSAIVSPSTAGAGIDINLLPWWGGALVLLGYAVVAGALGALITLRRDIT